MAGTALNSTVVAGPDKPATPSQLTASVVNAFRISAVADRLANHICSNPKADVMEFFNLCLSLARGIDYAIANDEVPDKAPELPSILKKVCQYKNEPLLLASIMVLMISVKNACKRKWFSDKESEELHTLVNEIATSFTSAIDINTEATTFLSTISTIMTRFYPRMKMGHILAFLEVKSGYGAFVLDFHISKDTKSPPEEKIRLFVAQTDNTETSSCIVTPLNVNFLLNGKGVDRRTNVIMDTGPQNPTIVTQMLKYGTNLLQAVGQFNGNYIIAVAFMSVISDPIVPPALQDYVQPNVASLDSDSEVIEGPSRISLNCPISFSRIKIPVKGHLCKHLQCFDFENFVDINSRRPSWRCPHCNQNVCYTDIRIDQNMVKVLKEVGENVTDVIIFADGSWKAVIDSDEASDKQNQKSPICGLDGPTTDQQIPNPSNSGSDIMDLTQGDDPMDVINSVETEERKPSVNLQSQLNNLTEMCPNNPPPPPLPSVDDGFWSGIYLSTYGTGSNSDSQIIGGVSESAPANNNNMMLSPVLTDAVSPSVSGSSQNPNYHSLMHNFMLQQQQTLQSNSNINEYGQVPTGSSRQVNRTPIAVQALPVPTQQPPQQPSTQPAPQQRSQSFLPVYGNGGVHQFPRPQNMNTHQHQVSQMNSAALHQVLGSQSRVRQEQQQQTFISTPPAQPQPQPPSQPPIISGLRASTQIPNRVGSINEPTRVQPLHLRTQSPGLIRSPPAHMQRTPIRSQGVGGSGLPQSSSAGSPSSQHMRMMGSGSGSGPGQQRPTNFSIPVQPTRTPSPLGTSADRFRSNMGGGTGPIQQQHRADGSSVDPTAEQNWRPTGRMRGSLSGRAYSDAFNQFITSPAQPVQPTPRPSPPPGIGPQQLHVLATNNRNAHANSPHPTANANVGGSAEGT